MDKKSYGVKIEDKYAKMYDALHSELGGNKYRIVEAALEIFNELPSSLQRCLVSYKQEERQLIFEQLRKIGLNRKGKKRA